SSIKSKVEFDEKLLERNRHFLKDTSKLQKRIKIANDFNSSLNKFEMHSSIYESYLKELILKVEGYGAKLIFIIPPRLENYSRYDRLLGILKEGNLVNLSNPIEFPQFYRVENSFDLGHMNEKGARLLTRELFIKFKEYYEHFK